MGDYELQVAIGCIIATHEGRAADAAHLLRPLTREELFGVAASMSGIVSAACNNITANSTFDTSEFLHRMAMKVADEEWSSG